MSVKFGGYFTIVYRYVSFSLQGVLYQNSLYHEILDLLAKWYYFIYQAQVWILFHWRFYDGLNDELLMSTITNENTQGLGHFHSNNLLHMDIKPDNIFRRSTANSVMYKLGEFHLTTYWKTGYSETIPLGL